jgi:hypothetical protein
MAQDVVMVKDSVTDRGEPKCATLAGEKKVSQVQIPS